MFSEAKHQRLVDDKARLERVIKSMETCYKVPFNKIKRLDELLYLKDSKLSISLGGSIIKAHLKDADDYLHLAKFCSNNDLLMAALYFVEAHLREFGRSQSALTSLAKAFEALGDLESAWSAHEESGRVKEPDQNLILLAARLSKWDYIDGFAALPKVEALVRQMQPLAETARKHSATKPAVALPIFIVNLPDDKYRRMRAESSMALHGVSAQFRRGYKPADIPQDHRSIFRVPLSQISDGSYGNQYSQYQVWKEVAAGPHEAALILEDDSQLLVNPDWLLQDVVLPEGWDIVFANPRLDLSRHEPHLAGTYSLLPFEKAFARFSYISPNQGGFGIDCYLLSKTGAQKLQEIVESEGFHRVGTDWYLQTHCIHQHRLEDFNPESSIQKGTLNRHKAPFHNPLLLNGYVLCPSFTIAQSTGIHRGLRI